MTKHFLHLVLRIPVRFCLPKRGFFVGKHPQATCDDTFSVLGLLSSAGLFYHVIANQSSDWCGNPFPFPPIGRIFCCPGRRLTEPVPIGIMTSLFPIREDRTKKAPNQRLVRLFRHRKAAKCYAARSYSSTAADSTLGAATDRLKNAGVSFFA